jgi:dTDP-4-dehydrorhamnose reductase
MVTRQKILVTGAQGQLGQEIRRMSAAFGFYEFIFLSREEMPVDDEDRVKEVFNKHRPQFCINCAAYTAVDRAESEKEIAFRVNSEGVRIIAGNCKDHDTQLVHISTDYVFDGESKTPYTENSPVSPQSVYGASKLEGEKQAIAVHPSSIIIRTSWVYSEFGKNFVKTMLRLMKEKDEISVVNDQYGSPTYAADLAEVVITLLKDLPLHREGGPTVKSNVYNYSNQGVITWYDFALAIKEISGSNCKVNPISTSGYPTPARRPGYSVLDTHKIRFDFNVRIRDWKDSLKDCMERLGALAK